MKKTRLKGYSYDSFHFVEIARIVDRIIAGEIRRARIHMPPRHAKTETVTKPLPLYLLTNRPGSRILVTGYSMAFARKLSRSIRNRAMEMGIEIAEDKSASDEWYTANGSMVMARGVGNVPTGEGFDLIIVDDPIRDRKQADSAAYRDSLWEWWTEGLMTRVQPKGAVVGVWTRWHEDDPAGRMDDLAATDAKADQWHKLILKALAEEDDPMGRKPGQALWPLMWDVEALANRRASMMTTEGSRAWEALYQQNPTPREGALFKVSQIQYCDPGNVPEGLQMVRRWDMAASAGKNDFTVGLKLAGPDKGGRFYVLDVVRGQWSVGERNKIIVQTAQRDGPGVRILGPIDPGSSGVEAAQHFRTMLSGYNVRTERETGSKEVRAGAPAAIVEDGRLFLLRGHWNPEFVEELRQFPNGVHDDQVDTLSGAVAELALKAARIIDWG